MRKLGMTLSVVLPLALVGAAGLETLQNDARHPALSRPPAAVAQAKVSRPRHCVRLTAPFLGVTVPAPVRQSLAAFSRAAGVRPTVVQDYTVFGDQFNLARSDIANQAGAVSMTQWLPFHTSLAAIAAGRFDGYIRRFAQEVRAFSCPVLLSFAHEMNGPWFPWSRLHQSPASFRAAWRHLHHVFAQEHASNAVWVFNPNRIGRSFLKSPALWWPGAGYVNMIALDGYYWLPSYTFTRLFDASVRLLRRLAPGKPIFIAETGAYPGAKMGARILDLFRGAAANHLTGIVYFDLRHSHADWRIEGHPGAISGLRAGAELFMAGPAPSCCTRFPRASNSARYGA